MTPQDAMNIAAQAWEQVKPEDDPPFEQCAPDHKFRLAYKVESVAKTGTLEDDFDRAVYAILHPPQGVSPVTPIPDAPAKAEEPVSQVASETQDAPPPTEPTGEKEPSGEVSVESPAPVASNEPKQPKPGRARANK